MPTLILYGHCPGKKNAYRRSRHGGMFRPEEVRRAIDSLILQASSQWKNEPIMNAKVTARFFVRDGRGDLDGKFVTLLDCLVKARVIRNDSIAHVKEEHLFAEIADDGNERVIVDVTVDLRKGKK